jgi:hypothetical protein
MTLLVGCGRMPRVKPEVEPTSLQTMPCKLLPNGARAYTHTRVGSLHSMAATEVMPIARSGLVWQPRIQIHVTKMQRTVQLDCEEIYWLKTCILAKIKCANYNTREPLLWCLYLVD